MNLQDKQTHFWARFGVLVTLLYHGFYAAWLLCKPISPHITVLGDDVMETLGGFLAATFCIFNLPGTPLCGHEKKLSSRIAWLCGLSMVCYGLQQVYIIYPDFAHHPPPISRVLPDVIALSSYPLLLLGIWSLPRRKLSLSSQGRISLDGLMVMTAVLTFSWYFLIGPTFLTATSTLEAKIVEVLYPTMDFLLAACLLLLGGRTGHLKSVLNLFAVGLVIVVASDSLFAYISLHETFPTGTLMDIGWSLGFMLIGVAVFAARYSIVSAEMGGGWERFPPLWKSLLPYALLPIMSLLVLHVSQTPGSALLRHGVFWGSAILVSLILLRQVLALVENRELNARLEAQATTDPLTGLLNHRMFHHCLGEEATLAVQEDRHLAIAMLDLDNFKFFNDAYGHAAGDDVLRQVASALRACTRPGDTLARFGGDEFALILPLSPGEPVEDRQAQILTSSSALLFQPIGSETSIPITISLGVAMFPQDQQTPLEVLDIADRRLMQYKTGASDEHPAEQLCLDLSQSLAGFPMLNALVSAVDNKDRYTRRHSEDVLTYSLQIADALGLPSETRRVVQIAALLHDVGKIGVPDRVLRKPGRLTEEEYEAVRQHPVMGAIIVGAVPGFEEMLEVIRHHHERWDGQGYPFGLHGEETPFLARLVAVADAFSAMTTDRPYRKGMSRERALQILEDGAGTQWDPHCVHALLRVYYPVETLLLAA